MDGDTISNDMTIAGGEGTLLANRYRIIRQLGQGGMGSVWLVEDTQLDDKPFAIKMLPAILVSNKRAYRQLKDEALVAMRLVHPNIVQIRAFEENNGNPFLVMDYVDGQTLDDYLADCFSRVEHVERVEEDGSGTRPACPFGGISEAEVLRILRPIAAALDYAHGEGVVHRDVKPANVMIRKDGHPFILDFGIAREIQETMTRVTGKLSSGTLLYMSPEQLMGEQPKPAQDVYSFAAMVYECLKGEPPFAHGQIEFQIMNKQPEPLPLPTDETPVAGSDKSVASPNRAFHRGSGTLAASVMAGLAKKPEDRPATCAAVLRGSGTLAASVGAVNGSGTSAASPRQQLPGGARSRAIAQTTGGSRSRVTAAILVAAVLAIIGGVWWVLSRTVSLPVQKAPTVSSSLSVSTGPIVSDVPVVTNDTSRADEEARRRARDEEERKAAEEVKARERAAEFIRLKTEINIKISDAKRKMDSIARFRADPEGLSEHIKSADEQWKTISAMPQPASLDEAKAASNMVYEAEAQIALDLDWLENNKADRDAAKVASAEIDALLKGDSAKFEPDKDTSETYGEGLEHRKQGETAFKKGEFAEAGRLMKQAKERFEEAARDAKEAIIKTTLESATGCFKNSKWDDCIAECDKVLGWDSANAEANDLKSRAEAQLVPSLTLVVKIGDRKVRGAKVRIDGKDYDSPVEWKKLSGDSTLGPYSVTYTENGRRYEGTFAAMNVSWRGPKTIPVYLDEYTGPTTGAPKTLTLPGGATMEMIYCGPGDYVYGDDNTQMHMDHGFWLGKCEVTQRQWQSVMGDNPSSFKGEDRPVENVSWEDCQRFISKVDAAARRQLGGEARLPNEHEWEYACRAGTKGPYAKKEIENYTFEHPAVVKALDEMGWFRDNSGYGATQRVGRKSANGWGFYDMHGNVWEWCEDAWGSNRVSRGGCWGYDASICRSASRYGASPSYSDSTHGFRLCCSAGPREGGGAQEGHIAGRLSKVAPRATQMPAFASAAKPVRCEIGVHGQVQLWEGGPYWATTNIGAEKPWEAGYYFWWGDTVGYKRVDGSWVASDGSSSNFSFRTSPTWDKSLVVLRSAGWITTNNALAPEHDAAHVQWGGRWRMPTDKELHDLCENCDWSWTTQNGVNGYVVSGRGNYTSASIFFPAAGFIHEMSPISAGSHGNYWSSVPYLGRDRSACNLFFDSRRCRTSYSSRYSGHPIRPVQGFTK